MSRTADTLWSLLLFVLMLVNIAFWVADPAGNHWNAFTAGFLAGNLLYRLFD